MKCARPINDVGRQKIKGERFAQSEGLRETVISLRTKKLLLFLRTLREREISQALFDFKLARKTPKGR